MKIESNNEITLRLSDIRDILEDSGMHTLLLKFRLDESHPFIFWLENEYANLVKTGFKGDELVTVFVEHGISKIAVYVFSKLAYKVLCDTSGRVVPDKLLHEVACLEEFYKTQTIVKPRRIRGDLWDSYESADVWIKEVLKECEVISESIVKVISCFEDMDTIEEAFSPSLEVVVESLSGVQPQTSYDNVVIDLLEFKKCYKYPIIEFNDLSMSESWHSHGWFKNRDWQLVLTAKLIVQFTEAFRLFMKRCYRRTQNVEGYEKYSVQDGEGYIKAYKSLRDALVERQL